MRGVSSNTWRKALLLGGYVGVCYFAATCFPMNNPDTYGHLAQGRQIAELGHVPKSDSFSFWEGAAAKAWNNYEWLSDVLLWNTFEFVGVGGLVLGKCLVAALIGILLFGFALSRTPSSIRAQQWLASFVVLALCVARVRLTLRPQLVGYLIVPLLLFALLALERQQKKSRRLAIVLGVLAMQVVWVNAHGSHLVGLGIVACLTAATALKEGVRSAHLRWLLALLVGQVVVSGISPFGYAIFVDAIEHVVRPEYRSLVSEWGGWNEQTPLIYTIVWLACCIVTAVCARTMATGDSLSLAGLFVLVGFAWLSYRSVRFTVLFAFFTAALAAPSLVRLLAESLSDRVDRWGSLAALWLAPAAVYVTTSLPQSMEPGFSESHLYNPYTCTRWLADKLPDARVYSTMADGWYTLYAAPHAKVVLDGRVPFYGIEHVNRVAKSMIGERPLRPDIESVGANALLIRMASGRFQPAVTEAASWSDWGLACVENRHALFVRRDAGPSVFFDALPPRYDPLQLWTSVDELGPDAVSQEIGRVPDSGSARGYRAWAEATLKLSSFAQPGEYASLRVAKDAADKHVLQNAVQELSHARHTLPGLPVIELQLAASHSALCRGESAKQVLDGMGSAESAREALLLRNALLVRAGRRAEAGPFLEAAAADARAMEDPWVRRLVQGEEDGLCAATSTRP